jgi:transposase
VSVVNPARIKGFAQCELVRLKTDKSDAHLIARFCNTMKPDTWTPLPSYIYDLRSLLNQLEALSKYERQEKVRLHEAPSIIKKEIKSFLNLLANRITKLKEKIRGSVKQHGNLQEKCSLITSIPGIGEVTAWRMLPFLFEPERFKSAKQVAAYLGFNPKPFCSGTSVRGKTRLSKTADRDLRKALYMPAVVAKQHNLVIRQFCERLEKKGKHKMLIIGAAMRKLIHLIYGVLISNQKFDQDYENKLFAKA